MAIQEVAYRKQRMIEERAKYRAEDLIPDNLKKMKEDELEKVIKLFPHLKSIDTGMIL